MIKRNVIVYSRGADGSEDIDAALKRTPGIRCRKIQTLCWKKIAATRLLNPNDRQARLSEKILRHELPAAKPLYFITLAGDPIQAHLGLSFRRLYREKTPNNIGACLYAPAAARAWFNELNSTHSTQWFEQDYRPATGLSVAEHAFDKSVSYARLAHRYLVLRSDLCEREQQDIIADFLERPISPILSYQDVGARAYLAEFYHAHCLPEREAPRPPPARSVRHKKDAAILTSMATYARRAGHIEQPLQWLEAIADPAPVLQKRIDALRAEQRYINRPYKLAPRTALRQSNDNKTILYTPHQARPYHTSGYAARTHALSTSLRDQGWDMHLYTRAGYPADTGITRGLRPRTRIDGMLYRYDTRRRAGKDVQPFDQYIDEAAAYICDKAAKVRPLLIHSASNYLCGLAGIEAARRLNVSSIYEMRGLWHVTRWAKEASYVHRDQFKLAQNMELQCAHDADHVLAITGALKDWLVEHGICADKISLAPNAVDTNLFKPAQRDRDYARSLGCENKIVIGYIGSFVAYEGLDLLIEAVAMLPKALQHSVRLLWVGDGPMLQPWIDMARERGIDDLLISLGRIPFEEVPRAYSITDICVFPRRGDAVCEIISPLKPFEAMAMEKTVIVSNVRPLEKIIEPGITGLIHEKNDAASLSEQLGHCIDNADVRRACGIAAREWVKRTRRWDMIARDISGVYERLAA